MQQAPNPITITLDGVKYTLPGPGSYNLKDLAAVVKEQSQANPALAPAYASLTVGTASPLASQSSSVGPNGSYTFLGGEVVTSTLGT